MTTQIAPPAGTVVPLSLGGLFRRMLRVSVTSFGGSFVVIEQARVEMVDRTGWATPEQFKLALGVGQIIPGYLPIQVIGILIQLAAGWRAALLGSLALMAIPNAVLLLILAGYVALGNAPFIRDLFYGVEPALAAVLTASAIPLILKTNGPDLLWWVLAVAGLALTLSGFSFLLLGLIGAGLVALLVRLGVPRFRGSMVSVAPPIILPLLAVPAWLSSHTFSERLAQLALLSAEAAVSASGLGIIAVIRSEFVLSVGWLTEQQLVDTLTLNQVIPGASSSVAGVGFIAAGVPGALVALISFMGLAVAMAMIAAAVLKDRMGNPWIRTFLLGAAAASTGAIAGAVFQIAVDSIDDVPTALIALVGFGFAFWLKWPTGVILLLGMVAGVATKLATGELRL